VNAARPRPLAQLSRALARLLLVAALGGLVATFGFTTVRVEGASMEPSLHHGDRALVPRLDRWWPPARSAPIERGDIVYFRPPGALPHDRWEAWQGGPFVIKRVVAVGGETLRIEQGRVWIGAVPMEEPYLDPEIRYGGTFGPLLIPAGHIFVLGDNRSPLASRDSRVFGAVPEAIVAGRPRTVVWPLWRHDPHHGWRWNVGGR
jgi:signal peptidase I